ncbi:ABC transporter permease [Syntrophomonas curvata]
MRFKALTFEEYAILALFAAVAFLSLVFAGYISDTYNKEKLSQGYYGSNTVYIQVNDPSKQLDQKSIYASIKDAIIFQELAGERVRAVFFRGNIEPPPLLKGRFFKEADFFCGKKLVVIGNAYNPIITERKGHDYIKINQENYEVIGHCGGNEISKLDYMLMVNADAIDPGHGGLYAIDGNSKQNIAAAVQSFKNEVGKAGGSYSVIEREPTGIKRLMKSEQTNTLLYFVLVLVFILSSVAVNLSLYEKKKREIAIQRLLGFSSKNIIGQILRDYTFLAHVGFFLGLLAALFLASYNKIHLSSPLAVVASYLALMIFGLLLIILPTIQTLHNQTRELLSE